MKKAKRAKQKVRSKHAWYRPIDSALEFILEVDYVIQCLVFVGAVIAGLIWGLS